MQMQFFAFGAKCGGFGASGLRTSGWAATSRPSSRSSDATASRPMPLALVARKLRRDWSRDWCRGCMASTRCALLPDPIAKRADGAEVILGRVEGQEWDDVGDTNSRKRRTTLHFDIGSG